MDRWDLHISLVKHVSFFSKEDAISDSCVGVFVSIVIQVGNISLSDEMKNNRVEEGKKNNNTTEYDLGCQALESHSQSGLLNDEGH